MVRNLLILFSIISLGLLLADPIIAITSKENCFADFCVKVYSPSGKIAVTPASGNGEDDPRAIIMEFVAFKEVDADGKEVGKTGPINHSFTNFTFLNVAFVNGGGTYKGIKVATFNFNATIGNALFNVPVYLFSKNGTIDLCDDETIEIEKGMVKFTIELSNWNFCKAGSVCNNQQNIGEIATYMDIVMTVKTTGNVVEGVKEKKQAGKKRKAQKFFFGTAKSITFPSGVNSDGSCTEMPAGFPKLEVKGSNQSTVTFRFPKFDHKIIYDPVINIKESEIPPIPNNNTTTPSTTTPSTTTTIPLTTLDGSKLFPSVGVVMILGVFARLLF